MTPEDIAACIVPDAMVVEILTGHSGKRLAILEWHHDGEITRVALNPNQLLLTAERLAEAAVVIMAPSTSSPN